MAHQVVNLILFWTTMSVFLEIKTFPDHRAAAQENDINRYEAELDNLNRSSGWERTNMRREDDMDKPSDQRLMDNLAVYRSRTFSHDSPDIEESEDHEKDWSRSDKRHTATHQLQKRFFMGLRKPFNSAPSPYAVAAFPPRSPEAVKLPMFAKAPKPYGPFGIRPRGPVAVKPPMLTKGPKPYGLFGVRPRGPVTVKPPMFAKAPRPYGPFGIRPRGPPTVKPPMFAKAPRPYGPFGIRPRGPPTVKPPIFAKAPRPYGPFGIRPRGPPTVKPPMFAKVPRPYGPFGIRPRGPPTVKPPMFAKAPKPYGPFGIRPRGPTAVKAPMFANTPRPYGPFGIRPRGPITTVFAKAPKPYGPFGIRPPGPGVVKNPMFAKAPKPYGAFGILPQAPALVKARPFVLPRVTLPRNPFMRRTPKPYSRVPAARNTPQTRTTTRVPTLTTKKAVRTPTLTIKKAVSSTKEKSEGYCTENPCKNGGLCFPENGASEKCACIDYNRGRSCEKKMDTCSDICVEVGDCVYILKDTALCVCNVPVKHFCRVTSATLTITVKDQVKPAMSTNFGPVLAVFVVVVVIGLCLCVNCLRARGQRGKAREAYKASLARGVVPNSLPPNFMTFFCCRGNKPDKAADTTSQQKKYKQEASQPKNYYTGETSEAEKKKKKRKDRETKKSNIHEDKSANKSANSPRRQIICNFSEDVNKNFFDVQGYYSRNINQGFHSHQGDHKLSTYNTISSPVHYDINILERDDSLRERRTIALRPPISKNPIRFYGNYGQGLQSSSPVVSRPMRANVRHVIQQRQTRTDVNNPLQYKSIFQSEDMERSGVDSDFDDENDFSSEELIFLQRK